MRPIGRLQVGAGSLQRRSSGRRLSAIGATIVVFGAVPPWWTIGGAGLAPEVGNAFDTPGFLGFFAALATLFLIVAPEAIEREIRADWWPIHLALAATAGLAFLAATLGAAVTATGSDLPLSSVFGLGSAPGLWITLVGLVAWGSGVAQLIDARDDR